MPFWYYFQKERLKAKLPLPILLVLRMYKDKVTRNVLAVFSFVSLSFQKDKDIAKKEQAYVNATCSARKIEKPRKTMDCISTCQEHFKWSS